MRIRHRKPAAENQAAARAVLACLAYGDIVQGISSPPFKVPKTLKLLGSSYKVEKGRKKGFLTGILYLAPAKSGGIKRRGKALNLCPWSTQGCRDGCLVESGRLRFNGNSRQWKTALYHAAPDIMHRMLVGEVAALESKAAREGVGLAIRLDGTSDLGLADRWSLPSLFPSVMFYDYTKSIKRIAAYKGEQNRHLTFSASEAEDSQKGANLALEMGLSVAAIVPAGTIPDPYALTRAVLGRDRAGTYIESGDETDARFLDPGTTHRPTLAGKGAGTIVYLGVKGGKPAEKRLGGMVYHV